MPEVSSVGTVILANGSFPAPGSLPAQLLERAERVVCCDGAADRLIAGGRIPDAIVGDGDSVSMAVRNQYPHLLNFASEQ